MSNDKDKKKEILVDEVKEYQGSIEPEFKEFRPIRVKAFRWMPGIKYPGFIEKHYLRPNGEMEIWAEYNGLIIYPGNWLIIRANGIISLFVGNEFEENWESCELS